MKKLTAILLLLAMLFAFSSCAPDTEKLNALLNSMTEENSANTEEPDIDDAVGSPHLKIKKIGKTNAYDDIDITDCGLIYTADNGLYGLISPDGKTVGNAKYTYCKDLYDSPSYFEVSTSTLYDDLQAEHMNVFGLVDVSGNELIPEKYAAFDYLSDRFIQVYTVTEPCDNEDEAILYVNPDSLFTFSPTEDSIFFKGTWAVYDLQEKALVPGLEGTSPENLTANNSIIQYNGYYQDANNNTLLGNVYAYQSGYYTVSMNHAFTLYDTYGNTVMQYNDKENAFNNATIYDTDYLSMERAAQSSWLYYVCDKTGKQISADFTGRIEYIFPNGLVAVRENSVYKLCRFDGTVLTTTDYTYVSYEENLNSGFILMQTDTTSDFYDRNGNLFASCPKNDTHSVYTFTPVNTQNDPYCFYNFKSGNFDITGESVYANDIPFAIYCRKDADSSRTMVDSLTGRVLLQDYANYECCITPSGAYIYAENANESIDIYEVTFAE